MENKDCQSGKTSDNEAGDRQNRAFLQGFENQSPWVRSKKMFLSSVLIGDKAVS
ncbi:MAG: hypothetical protein PHX30_02210 [Candidatus Pacebacteria bacterium]|nr:hypothetical protein [Candidatus Paceibacterota bacterium]